MPLIYLLRVRYRLSRADFIYSHGEGFNLDVGYFPIKYNDNARNLGEYLFRSGTYPQYLTANFDFAAARVTGLNAFGMLFGNFNYKALLTINTEGATMGDPMKKTASAFIMFFLTFLAYGQVDTSLSQFWMMTYFINGQDNVGARLAFSSDTTGIRWQKYNNEAAILVPVTVAGANDSRMRDPMIDYDSVNRRFNMIWTVSWTGTVIGWDTSSLLKSGTWGPQVALAVSNSIANASYSWAPEIFWDDIQSKWMIYWSVSVSGTNSKIYYTMITGSDFRTFSPPQVLFDPKYDVIDADLIKVEPANYQMVFKNESGSGKFVSRAYGATTPQGPYTTNSTVVAAATTEGPSIVKQGNEYHIFVDHYSNNGIGVARSATIDAATSPWPESWCTFGTGTSRLVVSHCNVIAVPKALVKWMLYNDSTWVKFVRNKTNVKDFKPAPPTTQNSNQGDITNKLFDLSGRMVGIAGGNGASSKSAVGRLPAGVYFQWDNCKVAKKVSTQR